MRGAWAGAAATPAAPVSLTLVARSREEELERAVEVLGTWLAGEGDGGDAAWGLGRSGAAVASHEIGVFYGVQDPAWGAAAIEGLMERLSGVAPSLWMTEPSTLTALGGAQTPGIRIQPATFAGRAVYRVALLLWSDRFPLGTDPAAGSAWGRRLVVATRIAAAGDQ